MSDPQPAAGAPDEAARAARWTAVQALLLRALEHPPTERAAFLDTACLDRGLRDEVEAMLASHERRGAFDDLLDAVMAPLLAARGTARVPKLTRYEVRERLGGGGMGVVYRARDTRLGRDVALKFLPPHLSADESAKKRFFVEARAAAALEHPNICTIHEMGETEDGHLYLVMALYEGETLDRAIARGPLPIADALRIATEIARGLARAHEHGIVHRDIKPANVMLTGDGMVRILDFGIAKLADGSLTQTGGVLGTAAYMSPEQAFGELVDGRTDLWSLGVVLYEMLTGTRPFTGATEQALLVALLSTEPEPASALRPGVPAALDALLARALARRPADRFAGASEMLAALAAVPAAEPTSGGRAAPGVTLAAGSPRGAAAAGRAADSGLTRAGERRQATVLVATCHDYGALVERLEPETLERLTTAVRDVAVEIATRHGGIVNECSGDRLVLLFGVPAAHEDDYRRAVRAARELHERVGELAAPTGAGGLRLRSGVHTGLVVAQRLREGDRRFRITGAPLDVATRLSGLAEPDAVVISPECQRLVAPFFDTAPLPEVVLHADAPAVSPFRVLGESPLVTRWEVAERAGLSPYAGRSLELTALLQQLAAARSGSGRVAVVLGEPGAGKSRLLHELRRHADEATTRVLLGRCDAAGATTPYLPFLRPLSEALAVERDASASTQAHQAAARLAELDPALLEFLPLYLSLLDIASEHHPVARHLEAERLRAAIMEALTALFTRLSARRPLLLLLEDWHWADDASRGVVRQLAEIVPAHAMLLVVSARPEADVAWPSAPHQLQLVLAPLDPEAAATIARSVLGAEQLPPDLVRQLHARTGGNPFFLEEVCQALREEGAVVVRGGEAVVADASGAVDVPETVQGVIRTRIDRLDASARDALLVASVVGREFGRGVVEDIVTPAAELPQALERLKASGLIQQVSVGAEPRYRFKHILTQEVAYDTLLLQQRRVLHREVGRAIERRLAGAVAEHAERLAHHFSQAEEWPAAVRYAVQAADRTSSLSQFADALDLMDRAHGWVLHLPDDDDRRALQSDILLRQERLCETLGQRARQLRLIDELIALLAPHGASARLAATYLRQGDVFTLLQRFDAADRALGTSLRISRELGDDSGECNAMRSLGLLRWHEGRHTEARELVERTLEMDRARGDEHGIAIELANLGNILRSLGEPERSLDVLTEALALPALTEDPVKRHYTLHFIANVHRELGDMDGALRYLEEGITLAAEQRLPIQALFHLTSAAHIYLEQGRVEESLRTYERAVELAREARHADGLAQTLRMHGEVLFGLERFADALPRLEEAVRLFTQLEDVGAQGLMWNRIATARERLARPADARAAWEAARDVARRQRDRRAELTAVEAVARTARAAGEDAADAIARHEEALLLAMALGARAREGTLRNTLGILNWESGRYAEALRHYETALRIFRELGDRVDEGLMLNSLGATLTRLQRHDEARTALEEAVAVHVETGERRLEAHAHAALGEICLTTGRLDEARRSIERSLALRRELGDRRGEGWMLEHLGRVLRAEGPAGRADAALAEAAEIAGELGDAALAAAVARARDGTTNSHRR